MNTNAFSSARHIVFIFLFLSHSVFSAEDTSAQTQTTVSVVVQDFFSPPLGKTTCGGIWHIWSHELPESTSSPCGYSVESITDNYPPVDGDALHVVRFNIDKARSVDLYYEGSDVWSHTSRGETALLMDTWVLRERDTGLILSESTDAKDWIFSGVNDACPDDGWWDWDWNDDVMDAHCYKTQSLHFSLDPGKYEFISRQEKWSRDATLMSSFTLDVHSCDATFNLPNNQWRQISLPCNPGTNNKVSDIFNNLPGTYNIDWVLYQYNTTSSTYTMLGKNSVLKQGRGYWIIQKNGVSVSLKMPQGSTPNATATFGTFDIRLATKNGAKQWNMIGYPYDTAEALLYNIKVSTHSGDCAPDCRLGSDKNKTIIHKQFWTYEHNAYTQINADDNLNPWTAYWVLAYPDAAAIAPVKLMVTKR
jgi:hypothetical protein